MIIDRDEIRALLGLYCPFTMDTLDEREDFLMKASEALAKKIKERGNDE